MATPVEAKDKLVTDPRFWAATTERGVLTWFQSFAAELAVFETVDIEKLGLTGLPWGVMLSVATFAALTSFVTSVGKLLGGAEGPGFTERLKDKKVLVPAANPVEQSYPAADSGESTAAEAAPAATSAE